MEPSPAILRIVSGRNTKMMRMVRDDRSNRNTKIDLKPKKSARRPPITGPIAMLKFRTTRNIGLSVPDSEIVTQRRMVRRRAYWLDRS
jgi:hypothetical protein